MGEPPEVGMGATMCVGSDRYGATIVYVSDNKRTLIIQLDDAIRVDSRGPHTERQDYTHTPNPQGRTINYTLRKNGRWHRQGDPMKSGQPLTIGHRRTYQDPHI